MTLSELREEFLEFCWPNTDGNGFYFKDTDPEEVWALFEKELIKKNGSHSLAVYMNDLQAKNEALEAEIARLREEVRDLVLDDVPHRFQTRLLERLK